MATSYLREGEVITYSNAGSAITSGDLVPMATAPGIACVDIAATTGTGSVRVGGVHVLDKYATSNAFTQGQKVWWRAATSKAYNAVANGYIFIGFADVAAGATATTGNVKLANSYLEEGPRVLTAAGAITVSKYDTYSMDLTILCSHTSTQVVTLPPVADVPIGAKITIRKTGTGGAITITPDGSELVDGAATDATSVVYTGDVVTIYNNGTGWVTLSWNPVKVSKDLSSATAITVVAADFKRSGIVFAAASAAGVQAVSLIAAATVTGCFFILKKTGSAGAVTITPTAGTIGGGATDATNDADGDGSIYFASGTDWKRVPTILA